MSGTTHPFRHVAIVLQNEFECPCGSGNGSMSSSYPLWVHQQKKRIRTGRLLCSRLQTLFQSPQRVGSVRTSAGERSGPCHGEVSAELRSAQAAAIPAAESRIPAEYARA